LATGDSVDWHFDALCRVSEKDGERGDDQPELKLDPSMEAQPVIYNDLPKLRVGYDSTLIGGCKLFKLHGSLQQSERHAIFTGFSPQLTDSSSILFCTDVAARGLDVPDVTHVIQYDPPADVRDYIHRIGRTARLGKEGLSYIYLLPSEVEYIDLLEDYQCKLVEQDSKELLETLEPLATTQLSKKLKHMKHEVAATDVHMMLERFVQGSQQVIITLISEPTSCTKGILFAY
jgi:ATP-dependent RNA helicase DDX31/DBP7